MEPITGWPVEVLEEVVDLVELIIADQEIEEFYFGRTNDPERRRGEHDADEVFPVYKTDSLDNAKDMEEALIHLFSKDDRCSNKAKVITAKGPIGSVDPDSVQYVYVAVWFY